MNMPAPTHIRARPLYSHGKYYFLPDFPVGVALRTLEVMVFRILTSSVVFPANLRHTVQG